MSAGSFLERRLIIEPTSTSPPPFIFVFFGNPALDQLLDRVVEIAN